MAVRLSRYRRYVLNTVTIIYVLLVLYGFTNDSSRCRVTMPDPDSLATYPGSKIPAGNPCRVSLDTLGVVDLDLSTPNLTQIEAENHQVETGGSWGPSHCSPWQHLAIIVPYRDRWEHLQLMLRRLHPMLRRQLASYQIIVIEQEGDDKFNRGRLMNIGVVESLKLRPFSCFIFHDVDLLPENDKNIYYCDQHIRQLSSAIDEMRYHVMYYNYAGGVVALNYENSLRVNGYSNDYWGWGNEDDDFSARTMEAGLLLTRPPDHIGRFKMVRHTKQWRADNGYDLFLTWRNRWRKDGMNSLDESKYKVKKIEKHPLFTKIVVNVGHAPKDPPNLTGVPRETFSWFLKFFFP